MLSWRGAVPASPYLRLLLDLADHPCGIARHHRVGWHIPRDHRPRPHHRVPAYPFFFIFMATTEIYTFSSITIALATSKPRLRLSACNSWAGV